MPTQDQLVSLPFTGGLDTKTDAKLSVKLSRLENRVFRGGTLDRRYGTSALATAKAGGGSQTTGEALFPFDSELVRINGGTTYGLSSALNQWVAKSGGGHYSTLAATRIQRNTRTQSQFDQASLNGVTVFAWTELAAPSQGIHIAVYDETSGTFYQTGAAAISGTSTGQYPRVLASPSGTKVFIFFADFSGNLKLAQVDTASPTTAPTVSTLKTDYNFHGMGPTSQMDAVVFNGGFAVGYVVTGAGPYDAFNVCLVNTSGLVTATQAFTSMTDVNVSVNGIAGFQVQKDSNNRLYVFWADDGTNGITNTYYLVLSTTLSTVLAKTTLTGISYWLNAATVESSTGQITIITSSDGLSTVMASAVVSATGVVTSGAAIPGTQYLSLVSGACIYDGVVAFAVTNRQRGVGATINYMPTAFVMALDGSPIARALSGLCDYQSLGRLGAPLTLSGTTHFLVSERGRVTFTSATGSIQDVTARGVTRVSLTPTSAAQLPVTRLGDATYIGGALPRVYDGVQVVEAGFSLPPENLWASTPSGAGSLTPGSYQFKAVYSWVNARGELVRSIPSNTLTFLASASTAVPINVPTLPLSARDLLPNGVTVQVELYRTTSNGTVFFRDSSVSTPTFNSTSAGWVTFTSSQSDAALQSGELLYTTGGVLDAAPPPAHKAACVFKNRLVMVGLEDPYEVRFSSQVVKGEGVRFNEVYSQRVPSTTGPTTAVAVLDDKLVIFTRDAAYALIGDGPDRTGNGAFSEPQQLAGVDVGTTSPNSVVETADGIMFQGAKGLVLLGRDLQTTYIGAEVETYGANPVRAATLRPELEQVWFLTDSGSDTSGTAYCLVWDYHYKQWSVFPSYGGQAACYYQGKYTRVRSDGACLQEQPGTYKDSGAYYASVVEGSWLKPAGVVQGFQRVKRAAVLGTLGSDTALTWDVAFDYVDNYAAADTVSVSTSGTYTVGTAFQVRRLLRVQKCEALKFRFTDTASSGTGQGIALTSLDILFGAKAGAFKLPTAKSVG